MVGVIAKVLRDDPYPWWYFVVYYTPHAAILVVCAGFAMLCWLALSPRKP